MSYTPTNWQTGDTITASLLNKMEQGIKDNADAIPSSASDVGAVAVAQGVDHAGEFCVVGSDGNITTVTMTVWQGGSY